MATLASTSSARAGSLAVTTLNDSGPGSLRDAIAAAPSGDTITFKVKGTITLTGGALEINKDLNIEGRGPDRLEISGNNASRVFVIANGRVTLTGMTISEGLADGSSPDRSSTGGGILNLGDLTLANDLVSNNQAIGGTSPTGVGISGAGTGNGGGLANFGNLNVTATSFIGNLALGGDPGGQGIGGGVYHLGTYSADSATVVQKNHATTSNDNVGP